jgi:hypothetical protein
MNAIWRDPLARFAAKKFKKTHSSICSAAITFSTQTVSMYGYETGIHAQIAVQLH